MSFIQKPIRSGRIRRHVGGLVLDEALSHPPRVPYRDHFTLKRGDNGYHEYHDHHYFSVKTPQIRVVKKMSAATTTLLGSAPLTGASPFRPHDMMAMLRPTGAAQIPRRVSVLRTIDFGLHNQSPLPRRLVPNTFVGASVERESKRRGGSRSARSGGWFWNHEFRGKYHNRRTARLG